MEKRTGQHINRKTALRKYQLNKGMQANEWFLESCFKQVVLPEHAEMEGVRENLHV